MLEPMTLGEAAAVSGGKLEGDPALLFTSVSTDSRTIEAGALFVALKGENFDGHEYVAQALAKGALAAVVSVPMDGIACVEVPDTLAALQAIARLSREKFTGPVIGVTGSVGKTTTKDLLALALSPLGPVHKTPANLNNEIGLPLTILSAPEGTKALVLEMGMRGPGQIAELAAIAKPTVGVITGIGMSHVELLGSQEAIANAKGELFEALGESGLGVLPATDAFAETLRSKSKAPVHAVSLDAAVATDVWATNLTFDAGQWSATVNMGAETAPLLVPSPGRFNVQNALLAITVATHCGVSLSDACAAIENYQPQSMRLEVLEARSGATVLSDCYNAAPDSMAGALETLMQTSPGAGGKRIAVLGEMRELGSYAAEGHALVGRAIAKLKPEMLVLVGDENIRKMSAAAIAGGFSTDHIHYFDSATSAAAGVEFITGKGDIVLVKGSRGIAMETIVEALV